MALLTFPPRASAATPTAPAVRLTDVHRAYGYGAGRCVGRVRVLEGASLDLAAGEVKLVVGPAACGKTTLLLVAAGLLAPDRGTVERVPAHARPFASRFVSGCANPPAQALAGATPFDLVVVDGVLDDPRAGPTGWWQALVDHARAGAAVLASARVAPRGLAPAPVSVVTIRHGRVCDLVSPAVAFRVAEASVRGA